VADSGDDGSAPPDSVKILGVVIFRSDARCIVRPLSTTLLFALLVSASTAMAMELPDIPHKIQPDERLLIGGQPDEAALRQAAEAGIRVVVNLRGEDESVDFDQREVVTDLGMKYLRLPIADAADLTRENAEAFGEILATIGDQPALLHCASGNRVGAMYALHAGWRLGMDAEAAIELGRAHGLTGLEDDVRERLGHTPDE
jgi:uncharacterized protein (TIGR01244 family)